MIYEGDIIKSSGNLPWWFIFVAYVLLPICLISGAVFPVLYSLEWGPTLTLKWLSSFFLGTSENVIITEPLKSFSLALILVFVYSDGDRKGTLQIPPISTRNCDPEVPRYRHTLYVKQVIYCPCDKPLTEDQRRRRLLLHNKRKFHRLLKEILRLILYLGLVLVISIHQKTSEVFRQNVNILNIVTPFQKVSTTADVWTYMQRTLIQRMTPATFYNGKVKSYDELRFSGINYKLGPLRLRQVRVRGSCSIPLVMKNVIKFCIPEYKVETEDKAHYSEGWTSISTQNISSDSPYRYRDVEYTQSLPYTGKFGTYNGGGYLIDLDFDSEKAANSLLMLRDENWLDEKTRVLFVEMLLLNRNNMHFSQVKLIMEFPTTGGIFDTSISTANLYPYVNNVDYVVLFCQFVFVLIVVLRILALAIRGIRTRCRCFVTVDGVVQIFELVISISAIVFLVLRFIETVDALNRLRHDEGFLTSFGEVFVWDNFYSICLGVIAFKGFLGLLKPMSFNYHVHLMVKSIAAFRQELFHFVILLVLIIIGFASFIYLLYGYLETEFQSVSKGILTLLRMALGMIKFRLDLRLEGLGTFVIFGIYATIVTVMIMNFFISALNVVLEERKSLMKTGKSTFDWRLNHYVWNIFTTCLTTQSITNKKLNRIAIRGMKKKIDLKKGEKYFERFFTTLEQCAYEEMKLEKDFFKDTLLPERHFRGKYFLWNVVRKTHNGILHRFSTKSYNHDDVLIIEFPDLNQDTPRIGAERITVCTANEKGLIPYGNCTSPISDFYKFDYSEEISSKVKSSDLSTTPAFVVTSFGNYRPWQQYAAEKHYNNEIYITTWLPQCPRYLLAVTCSIWPNIPSSLRDEEINEFQISRDQVVVCPLNYKHLTLTFPKSSVRFNTNFQILVESRKEPLVFHILCHDDISGPIKVQCDIKLGKELSMEHFMETQILTKDGDLEWRAEDTKAKQSYEMLTFFISDMKRNVKKSVGVFLSDFKISFGGKETKNLGTEKDILFGIYKGKILSRHWRFVGRVLGVPKRDLSLLEESKPRSLEEKACIIYRKWLQNHPGQSLTSIQHIWN